MDTSNVSLADIAAVTDKNDGMFGGGTGGMWIFALLILLLIGGGGFFGNRSNFANGEPVTEAGLCNAMNFNNLENAVGRLGDSQQQGFTGLQRDLCQGFAAINAGINQARFDSQQCCCEIQRAIDGVKYSGAINTAAIQATSAENTQKILDAITGNRIADMQNQINQLQLQNSLCGVVRYPTMSAYNSGSNPFCGCGNPCCNI